MKGLSLAVFVLSLGVITVNAQAQTYRAPAHNYHQNNWISKG